MNAVITTALGAELDTDKITALLRDHGYLQKAKITSLTQYPFPGLDEGRTGTALLCRIDLRMTGDVDIPSRLVMKTALPDRFDINHHEIEFYSLMQQQSFREIPQVFAQSVNAEQGETLLLMEDLGTDTAVTTYPVPHAYQFAEKAVATLARVHAHWWQSDEFTKSDYAPMSEAKANGLIDTVLQPAVAHFADTLGDALSADRKRVIEQFVEQIGGLLGQHAASFPQTLVHGDPHLWNFFFPEDPQSPVRLIDWQSWDVDFPGRDLSHMMALQWYPERRARFEAKLLNVYHEALLQQGIEFSAEDLMYDYRMQTLRNLSQPIIMCFYGYSADIWWAHLERIFAAIDDLDCREWLS